MGLHIFIGGVIISSHALANEIFTNQNDAKSVLSRSKRMSMGAHNLEKDCFETRYCRWFGEMREGGENDPALSEFFSKRGSKYEDTKIMHKTYSKCHRSDKQCRKKGNSCACTKVMKEFLGLASTSGPGEGCDPKLHCFRVPPSELNRCQAQGELHVCHGCGVFTFNDGKHDWKKLAGNTDYDDIVCTTLKPKSLRPGGQTFLESFKMGTQRGRIRNNDNICMKESFKYADSQIQLPKGKIGQITSWTACQAFCGTTDLLVPNTKFDPDCKQFCEPISKKSAGVCGGDVFCNEICLLNENLWSQGGQKACRFVCKSACAALQLMGVNKRIGRLIP